MAYLSWALIGLNILIILIYRPNVVHTGPVASVPHENLKRNVESQDGSSSSDDDLTPEHITAEREAAKPPVKQTGSTSRGLEMFLDLAKPIMDPISSLVGGKLEEEKNKFVKGFMDAITPAVLTTSTTSTTTISPIEDLTKTIVSVPKVVFPQTSRLIDSSVRTITGVLKTSLGVSKQITNKTIPSTDQVSQPLLDPTDHLESAKKVVSSLSGLDVSPRQETEKVYYDFANPDDLAGHRLPKYFSTECTFRYACEVGKTISIVTKPVLSTVHQNRIIQDFQSRYTRALTYGVLTGDCSRYYCVFAQFLGGPTKFTAGMTDLVNRVVNPDVYQAIQGV